MLEGLNKSANLIITLAAIGAIAIGLLILSIIGFAIYLLINYFI